MATSITLRGSRPAGAAYGLTNAELDANFANLKTTADGAQTSAASAASTANSALTTANNAVPKTRQVGGAPLSADVPLKTVGGVSIVGSGDISVAGGAPAGIAYTTSVPLDSTTGRDMGLHVLTGNDNFAIATSPAAIDNGACLLSLQLASTFVPTFDASISVQGDAIVAEVGRIYEIAFVKRPGGPLAIVQKTGFGSDSVAPVIGTPHVENAAANKILLPITELSTPVINGTTAGVTLGGAGLGGRTCTVVAVVSGNLELTLSSAMAWNSVITVALASGMVRDASSNLSASKGATTVVNNLTMPVPGAPTGLTDGTHTSSSIPLSWTAPVVDATHGTPATYQMQARTTAGPGAWFDYGPPISHPTVSVNPGGLSPSTTYDFQGKSTNASGDSSFSTALTNKTTTAAATAFRFGTIENGNVTESGGGPFTYTYSAGTVSCRLATASHKFTAGIAGEVVFKKMTLNSTGVDTEFCRLSFDDVDNTSYLDDGAPILSIGASGAGTYYTRVGGSDVATSSPLWGGTKFKLVHKADNTLEAWSSADGVTWNLERSVAGSAITYYVKFSMGTSSGVGQGYQVESFTGMAATP